MVLDFPAMRKPKLIIHSLILYDGDLYHFLFKNGDLTESGNISIDRMNMTQNIPKIQSFSAIRIERDLHICAIDVDNHLLHCIRTPDREWTQWGSICKEGMEMVDDYRFKEVTVTYISQGLHVCAIREDNTLLHSIRSSNKKWTPWGDVCKDCEKLKDTKAKKTSNKIAKKISKIMSEKMSKKLKFRDLQKY